MITDRLPRTGMSLFIMRAASLLLTGLLLVSLASAHWQDSIYVKNSEIKYNEPVYPRFGFNLTLGMPANTNLRLGMPLPSGIAAYLGAVCALDAVNSKRAKVKVNGTINLQAFETLTDISQVYYNSMQLLQTNLYSDNATINAALKSRFPVPTGSLQGGAEFYQFFSVIPFFQDFRIPGINDGTPAQYQAGGSSAIVSIRDLTRSIFALSGYVTEDMIASIMSFILRMDWTFIGVVVQEGDTFGAEGLFAIELTEALLKYRLRIPCFGQLNPFKLNSLGEAQEYVKCLKNFDKVSVVLLWTSAGYGAQLIKQLNEAGGGEFYYIIMSANPDSQVFDQSFAPLLQYSMFMTEGFDGPTREEINTCIQSVGPEPFVGIGDFEAVLKFENACQVYADLSTPLCDKIDKNRAKEEPCVCDAYNAFFRLNNTVKYAFAYDSIMTLAEGLSLIQENCTYLNEKLLASRRQGIDFCSPNFTPESLSSAIGAVDFLGRTGEISFLSGSVIRKRANFEFYQWNENLTVTKVGQYKNKTLEVNMSAFIFPGGEIPVSAMVPDVPDLNDGYVAAFFGVILAVLVLDLMVIGWLIWNWKVKVVRRTSPLFLLITAVGVTSVLTAGIINSIGLDSSAMCALYDFFLVVGMTLILSGLLAKTWRIHRIFSYTGPDALNIADKNLILIPIALLILILIQYFVYTFAGGTIQAVEKVSSKNQFYTFIICQSPTSWFQTFQVIAYYVYFFLLICTIGVLSFLTRSIHAHYNESKNLATIVYIYMCFGIIFVPLYYTQGENSNSQGLRYSIVSMTMCILMLATLLILFLPLILRTRRYERKMASATGEQLNRMN